ncbi:hypothetical protein Lepto7375DRAFT_6343 [Leptolyngbya sp. PCC 7375]|nr:hypothetical protein Lepto7375DRAFT_6343 [Leptolyngbya sp. PCC 7375]
MVRTNTVLTYAARDGFIDIARLLIFGWILSFIQN